MIRILLLGAGTNAGFHFSKVIKERFQESFFIVGTDINPRHLIANGLLLDRFYQVPPVVAPDYYSAIIDICQKEKINYLLPIFDMDQKIFHPENQDLQRLNIKTLGTKKPLLSYYGDKEALSKQLKDHGILVPECFSLSEIDADKEYFIKPKNGYGSTGAQKAKGEQILNLPDRHEYIIQETCSAPEITVECFYYKKRLSSIARERLSVKAGVCNKARIYFDRELREIVERFAEQFSAPLCFNLQFMKNSSGKPVVTDVNLRFAGGMGLSHAAGWDVVSAIAECLLGHSEECIFSHVPTIYSERFIVRTSMDIVTDETKGCIAFDLDGTLLDSKARHCVLLHDLLLKRNINIDTSDLVQFKSDGKNNVEYMRHYGIDDNIAANVQQEWIKNIETEKYLKLDRLYPETKAILQHFGKKNNLVLISARQSESRTIQQLKDLEIFSYFQAIHIVPPGRNADVIKKNILLQTNANLMVGDTEIDYSAAQSAGIDFAFKTDGFRTLNSLCSILQVESHEVHLFNQNDYL